MKYELILLITTFGYIQKYWPALRLSTEDKSVPQSLNSVSVCLIVCRQIFSFFSTSHHVTTGALHGNGGWHAPPGVTSERRLARSTRIYIGTALRGVSVFTFLSFVCCLYVTFLLPLQPHTIGQTWSGPPM